VPSGRGAFFDANKTRGPGGLRPEQLAARIDLQMRRVVEGSEKVADRLRREVLYFVAVSAPIVPTVQAVQKAYGLPAMIPSAETLSADVVRLQPILREAREQLATAKEMWLKVTTGRAESLPKLAQTLEAVNVNATEIGNAPLTRLTESLVARLNKMPPSGNVSEPLAMEYATGSCSPSGRKFRRPREGVSETGRRDDVAPRCGAGRATIPAATAPILDEVPPRARAHADAAVAREIQVNLWHMEQVLDAFFRDHAKRAELATLGKDGQQIRGALAMLGEDDAARLLALCQEQIDSYADPDTTVGGEDLELLAESLSGLGFYVEAMEQLRRIGSGFDRRFWRSAWARRPRRRSIAARRPSSRRSRNAQCAAGARRRGSSRPADPSAREL
jgi:chemosensory pili system protein ChpA (sensor histidine kinase/response regulator)